MNKNLNKKILFYSEVAASLLLANNVNAQIIYTDINPDIAINGFLNHNFPYSIDLNNDGIADFTAKPWLIYSSYVGGGGIYSPGNTNYASGLGLAPLGYGDEVIELNGSYYYAFNLPDNQLISASLPPSLKWSPSHVAISSYGTTFHGGWPTNQEYYAGVRFRINNAYHYGWIRITSIDYKTFVIKDYAYEATPNTPILARTLATGISENSSTGFKLKQDGNNFSLFLENNPGKNILSVSNILGEEILKNTFEGNEYNFSINQKGMFIIRISNDAQTISKKIFVY